MKAFTLILLFLSILAISCNTKNNINLEGSLKTDIVGTWQLVTGTVIQKGDTVVTNYNKNISFIKIINATHFSFLQHDVNKGKDSTAIFVAGGGTYSITDSTYKEYLAYCSARTWEGNNFSFTVNINKDTLVQSGMEKVEGVGVNRMNIEKYIRVK